MISISYFVSHLVDVCSRFKTLLEDVFLKMDPLGHEKITITQFEKIFADEDKPEICASCTCVGHVGKQVKTQNHICFGQMHELCR